MIATPTVLTFVCFVLFHEENKLEEFKALVENYPAEGRTTEMPHQKALLENLLDEL